MALMKFREDNQVKWVGTRPGHAGTQINKSVRGVNNGTTILYTVTSGKTLHMIFFHHSIIVSAPGTSRLFVRDGSDVFLYDISSLQGQVDGISFSESCSFPFPDEIPAGYDIAVVAAQFAVGDASIFGWEE